MLPGKLSKRVITDRLHWVDHMVEEIQSLPLETETIFYGDSRNIWAAESCLRRALEALFDLGRHILAKGFASGVTEYKEIAANLHVREVISKPDAELMRKLAGYRNRLVHFYHDVSAEELYEICTHQLGDVKDLANALRSWLRDNQDKLDEGL